MLPETMETAKMNSALGYGKPPWVFKGSALYQFHLVKAETARAFIPKEFKLVEAFGYTLGGFFLANYEDSPAGNFDENVTALPGKKRSPFGGFLNKIGMADSRDNMKNRMDIQVKEMNNHTAMGICSINLTASAMAAPQNDPKKWMGPVVKISLPSFSGRTVYNPDLLKYSYQIECRLRAVVPPAKVVGPSHMDGEITSETDCRDSEDIKKNLSISVMLSKPILALEFNCLKMEVHAPTVVPQ